MCFDFCNYNLIVIALTVDSFDNRTSCVSRQTAFTGVCSCLELAYAVPTRQFSQIACCVRVRSPCALTANP